MSQRVVAIAYGYVVCFGALLLFAYALLALLPPSGQLQAKLKPVEVSVIDTDTSATMSTDTSGAIVDHALQAFDHTMEVQGLRASKQSFETARAALEAERVKLAEFTVRGRMIQRGLVMVFAAVVFIFHWRWLRNFSHGAPSN